MSERLTAEEVYNLRERQRDTTGDIPVTWRELNYLLSIHDIFLRLQTLEAKDITPGEMEAVRTELTGLVMRVTVAAVCRGMLKGGER